VRGGAGRRQGQRTIGTRRATVSKKPLVEDVVGEEKSTRKRIMEDSSEEVKKVKRRALEVAPTTRRSARIQQIVQTQLSTIEKDSGTSVAIGRRTASFSPPSGELPLPVSMEDLANTMSTMTLNKNDLSDLQIVVNDWRLEIPTEGEEYPVIADTTEPTMDAALVRNESELARKSSRQATPESVSSEECSLMLLASAAIHRDHPPFSQMQTGAQSIESLNLHEIVPNLFLGAFSISLLV
jgi:hypothetical protein